MMPVLFVFQNGNILCLFLSHTGGKYSCDIYSLRKREIEKDLAKKEIERDLAKKEIEKDLARSRSTALLFFMMPHD